MAKTRESKLIDLKKIIITSSCTITNNPSYEVLNDFMLTEKSESNCIHFVERDTLPQLDATLSLSLSLSALSHVRYIFWPEKLVKSSGDFSPLDKLASGLGRAWEQRKASAVKFDCGRGTVAVEGSVGFLLSGQEFPGHIFDWHWSIGSVSFID